MSDEKMAADGAKWVKWTAACPSLRSDAADPELAEIAALKGSIRRLARDLARCQYWRSVWRARAHGSNAWNAAVIEDPQIGKSVAQAVDAIVEKGDISAKALGEANRMLEARENDLAAYRVEVRSLRAANLDLAKQIADGEAAGPKFEEAKVEIASLRQSEAILKRAAEVSAKACQMHHEHSEVVGYLERIKELEGKLDIANQSKADLEDRNRSIAIKAPTTGVAVRHDPCSYCGHGYLMHSNDGTCNHMSGAGSCGCRVYQVRPMQAAP